LAYQTYITEALVCGSYDSLTSDRSFLIFTRDAGMVYVHAKSIREERSKHRYALQDFSHVRITLVRGKTGWKVTGTEPIQNFYANTHSREERALLRNIVVLLRRVMQGETAHESIFGDVVTALSHASAYELKKLETILSFRILHTLGYVAPLDSHSVLIDCELSPELVKNITENEVLVYQNMTDKALLESHL
jgi:recombinational DNA repair protein (RecF pathway)